MKVFVFCLFLSLPLRSFASVQIRGFCGVNFVNWDALFGLQNSMNKNLGDQDIRQIYFDGLYGADLIFGFGGEPSGISLGLRYDNQTIKATNADKGIEYSWLPAGPNSVTRLAR